MGTLYVNGLIRTMAHEEDVHSAMFVEKTRIIAMGEDVSVDVLNRFKT